jgi:hypothetical protein
MTDWVIGSWLTSLPANFLAATLYETTGQRLTESNQQMSAQGQELAWGSMVEEVDHD